MQIDFAGSSPPWPFSSVAAGIGFPAEPGAVRLTAYFVIKRHKN
jgi:hypothetical protein